MSEEWYYKVTILANSEHEDAVNPAFRFKENQKEELSKFIFTCLDNGHEISVVNTTEEFDNQ